LAEPPLLVLLRHGETESNRLKRFAGWNDEHLTPEGRLAVGELADALDLRGGRLYTSPVRRAVETAEILADRLSLSVHTVHDLHEIELGEWKGMTTREVSERWPVAYRDWLAIPERVRVPGRESLGEVRERAMNAIDQIGKAELSESVAAALVVTHLALIRVLWLAAERRPLSDYHEVSGDRAWVYPLRWEGRGRVRPAGGGPRRPAEVATLLS